MRLPGGRLAAKHLCHGYVIDDPCVPGVRLTILSSKRRVDGMIHLRVARQRQQFDSRVHDVQLHPDQRLTVCDYGP